MNNNYTFWQILKHTIQIPIIQRDYAQGRDSPMINRIRDGFLDAIHNSLTSLSSLHLDFVYGSIKNNSFIPLDGQQRLTTLFLLHWYMAWKEGLLKNTKVSDNLVQFTYKTRDSSREFCSAIVKEFNVPYCDDLYISDEIKKSAWYFLAWNRDPTITSMLKMLDEIHKKFFNTTNMFALLTDEKTCPISFEFLDLKKFNLNDELYVRMNARGKALTNFEIFKSRLQQHIDIMEHDGKLPMGYKDCFMLKMDVKWLDFFWSFWKNSEKNDKKEKKVDQTDNSYLYFLLVFFDNYYFSSIGERTDNFQSLRTIDEKLKESFDRISSESILELEKLLDIFTSKGIQAEYDFTKPMIDMNSQYIVSKIIDPPKEGLIYADRLKFFSYCCFLVANPEYQPSVLPDWMRVMTNLIENTIYDTSAEYIRDLKVISSWKPYSAVIVEHIAKNDEASGFNRNQLQEEKIKADLILRSDYWKTAIELAEEHPYFAGQIDFLLDFAEVKQNLPVSSVDDGSVLSLFKEYYEKAEAIFGNQGVITTEGLWRRALLCIGDYSLKKGYNTSFVINGKDRDISWKRLLRDNTTKRSYLKNLLTQLDPKNIKQALNNVIDKNKDEITDWRRYFIRYPEIMERECGEKIFVRFSGTEDILLLWTTRTSGYCSEYYSYAFYCELKRGFPERDDIEYHPSQGYDAPKSFSLNNTVKNSGMSSIYIGFDRNSGKWVSSESVNMEHCIAYEDKDDLRTWLVSEKYIHP
jgi:hypothetical protein